jgi:hypothetical protein
MVKLGGRRKGGIRNSECGVQAPESRNPTSETEIPNLEFGARNPESGSRNRNPPGIVQEDRKNEKKPRGILIQPIFHKFRDLNFQNQVAISDIEGVAEGKFSRRKEFPGGRGVRSGCLKKLENSKRKNSSLFFSYSGVLLCLPLPSLARLRLP